jgi:hypothetical protein
MTGLDYFWSLGPIVMSGGLMLLVAYTSFGIWRAHKRAMQSLENYTAAMEAATERIKEDPDGWMRAVTGMDENRRTH